MKMSVSKFVKEYMSTEDFPAIMEALVNGRKVQVEVNDYCVDLTENTFSEDVLVIFAELMEDTKLIHVFCKFDNEVPVFEYQEEAKIFKLSRDIQSMDEDNAEHYENILQGLKNDLECEKRRG